MIALIVTVAVLFVLPLPYGVDGAPPLRRTPVTLALLIANFALFFGMHYSLHGALDPTVFYDRFGVKPALFALWQLVTYSFVHVNFGHVLWNMVYLFLFGPTVERRMGSGPFLALYLVGGIAAGLLNSVLVLHYARFTSVSFEPLVGASGAISAVLGAFAVFGGRRLLQLFWAAGLIVGRGWEQLEVPAGFIVTIWIAQTAYGALQSVVSTDAGGVAYFAHLGGLAFGVLCGIFGGLARPGRRELRSDSLSDAQFRADGSSYRAGEEIVGLLERALDAGDTHRARMLHSKCVTIGARLSSDLIERLNALED